MSIKPLNVIPKYIHYINHDLLLNYNFQIINITYYILATSIFCLYSILSYYT